MPGFATDISKMIETIEKIVSKVTITPERKLSLSQEVYVESFIDQIDYKIEDTHIFNISFFNNKLYVCFVLHNIFLGELGSLKSLLKFVMSKFTNIYSSLFLLLFIYSS